MPWIYIGTSPLKEAYVGTTPVKEIYVGTTKVRPTTVPWLCFTAEGAGTVIKLAKTGSPTSVTLETSTDMWSTWSTYTFWNSITLSNVWDKVLFRNTSSTTTNFSTTGSDYYKFTITWGKAWCSWDVTYLINKDGGVDTIPYTYLFNYLFNGASNLTTPPDLPSTTLKNYCYRNMFNGCTSLTTVPELPATTLGSYCYQSMFSWCTSLTTLPKLPATAMKSWCYRYMFQGCSLIKLSSTQTWDYQTPYRIPTTWTGTTATNWNSNMFVSTWWTFLWAPAISTTYYTSNTLV